MRRLPVAAALSLVLIGGSIVIPGPATAAPAPRFASLFESGDPPPTWVDTAERTSGVDGRLRPGLPGTVAERVTAITASGEHTGAGEVKENLNDADPDTKWLVFATTGWAAYQLDAPVRITRYALTAANDVPERDPRDWLLEGSADGSAWTTVDARTGQTLGERGETTTYDVATPGEYRHYRLSVTANSGADVVQLADLQLSDGDETPLPPEPVRSAIGDGPGNAPAAKARVGYSGLKALEFAGRHAVDGRGYTYNKVYDVNLRVNRDTELSYLVFPEFSRGDLSYPATYTSVDLAFTDGTFLSGLKARDQHSTVVSPQAQGEAKTLSVNQWNKRVTRIGDVARGKTIDRILVAYDKPAGPASPWRAWFDDITIADTPAEKPAKSLAGYVETRRGTQSSGAFSRGNNIPATAVPHGFNFWTPVTNAGTLNWLYEYHKANNAQNLPALQALSVSHEPSPWMADRQTFQFMPQDGTGVPNPDRVARALPFHHENEVAKPHYYGVTFDSGLKAEIAPTDHAAVLRFTFTGDGGTIIFDNMDENAGLTIDAATGVITGWSDVRGDLSNGATRMFLYGRLDAPVTASGMLPDGNRPSTGYVTVGAKTVNLRVATSLISVAQARHNLDLEVAAADTVESVRARAEAAWNAKLRTVEVEGASRDQLVTLYSNLYRLFLYPNSAFENTGTNAAPVYRHAVQSSTTTPPSTPTETGAEVKPGKVYVNNGFWDTYRTTWPAYSLLTPKMAGEMADGFVQQYRDGGWISRWSSPGYANLMVGTSSDVAFADAYLKGVKGFDLEDAYAAAVKNASVTPPNDNVGRKGMRTAIFKGYTPLDVTGEAFSWAMDGYINDFGIANMAAALAERGGPDAARYREEAAYYRDRALGYVNLFDPSVDFFQGKNSAGQWRWTPEQYDPEVWGHDYTETNGWNMAFHVPQDGQGLANLYGGRDELAKKLDEFFTDPEEGLKFGSYPGVIHEMTEARDVRMGQYGHSNQPSHHIPWMYAFAGQPYKTQALTREALSRLYLGSEIGQGYPGDEDNGEMSAWYVFAALGFYPLQMGSASYVIGSPLFTKATINLENGRKVVIRAPQNSPANVYVQSLKVNGKAWNQSHLPHSVLANGATLDFTMGATPSRWATGAGAVPPSLTQGPAVATPRRDVSGTVTTTALADDSSTTAASVTAQEWTLPEAASAKQYTITSAATAGADPAAWKLLGSTDGSTWTELDARSGQTFEWRQQTRPFTVRKPGAYTHYRLEFTGGAPVSVAELELLA
ncbi:GH92 family glycosyl hydrolase [Catenuloplanes atrovinosus]|uniref:Alpha-1,2-mannosidase n=1 Tax=Catenuloplanes atrovinosus TaxID=137266 RepID=A0AAE3YMB7_9ACTN|nr:putative alpha-1,2-mannosidase [Catenuloplanes atrovinosus]